MVQIVNQEQGWRVLRRHQHFCDECGSGSADKCPAWWAIYDDMSDLPDYDGMP